MAFLSRTIIT